MLRWRTSSKIDPDLYLILFISRKVAFLHIVDTLWDDTAGNSKADIQSNQRKKASYAFKIHCGFSLMIIHAGKMTTMGKIKKITNKPRGNEGMNEKFKFGGGRDGGDHLTSNSP